MNRLLSALCLAVCLTLTACGGSSSGYVPVDSPIMQFEPPDPDDLVAEEEDDADATEDDWDDEDEATPKTDDKAPRSEPAAKPGKSN